MPITNQQTSIKRGPWTQHSSKIIHNTPFLKLIVDDITEPGGKKGTYSYLKINHGVAVLPIDKNNQIYLIRQFRYPTNKLHFELIGGGIDGNETPLDAAKRELKEETGIVAKKFKQLITTRINPAAEDHKETLFLAFDLEFHKASVEGNEDIELISMPLKDAINLCMEGKIDHIETIAYLFYVKEYLEKKETKSNADN